MTSLKSDLAKLAGITVFIALVALSYQQYKIGQFKLDMDLIYKPHHYKVTQMSSDEVMCRDSKGQLCFCGKCN